MEYFEYDLLNINPDTLNNELKLTEIEKVAILDIIDAIKENDKFEIQNRVEHLMEINPLIRIDIGNLKYFYVFSGDRWGRFLTRILY